MGSLNEVALLNGAMHFHTESKTPWLEIRGGLPQENGGKTFGMSGNIERKVTEGSGPPFPAACQSFTNRRIGNDSFVCIVAILGKKSWQDLKVKVTCIRLDTRRFCPSHIDLWIGIAHALVAATGLGFVKQFVCRSHPGVHSSELSI